ncbi:LDCC motif putative metal-binding protein [Terrisporobacter vanillatitrophus]
MPKWLEKFLKRLEEANKKNFGPGKLDCCDLNKQTKPYNNSKNK